MSEKTDKTEAVNAENTAADPQKAQDSAVDTSDRPRSMRETIVAAIKENRAKESAKDEPAKKQEEAKPPADPVEKKAESEAKDSSVKSEKVDPQVPDDKSGQEEKVKQTEEQGEDTEKAQPSKPPTSWSRSSKALWDSLPPSIQDEVLRREENAQRGVDELKSRHKAEVDGLKARTAELETVVAPYDEAIRQAGRTRGQVVDQLFRWHVALSGPNRVQAFRQLAANLGVDVATLAGVQKTAEGQESASETGSQHHVQDMSWAPAVGELQRRLEQYEMATAAQQQAAAEKTVQDWAKDKPHFERVRQRMAQLINADAELIRMGHQPANGFVNGSDINMDAAYEAAVWADPELRAELIRGREEERDAVAKAAAEKARLEAELRLRQEKAAIEAERAKRAATSIKPAAPLSGVNGAAPKQQNRHESVRDSIRRALQNI